MIWNHNIEISDVVKYKSNKNLGVNSDVLERQVAPDPHMTLICDL